MLTECWWSLLSDRSLVMLPGPLYDAVRSVSCALTQFPISTSTMTSVPHSWRDLHCLTVVWYQSNCAAPSTMPSAASTTRVPPFPMKDEFRWASSALTLASSVLTRSLMQLRGLAVKTIRLCVELVTRWCETSISMPTTMSVPHSRHDLHCLTTLWYQ